VPHNSGLTAIKYQLELGSLLGDGRYSALIRKMNLPE
jgi:hypothetical protein